LGDVISGNNNVVIKASDSVKSENGFIAPVNSTAKVAISSYN